MRIEVLVSVGGCRWFFVVWFMGFVLLGFVVVLILIVFAFFFLFFSNSISIKVSFVSSI